VAQLCPQAPGSLFNSTLFEFTYNQSQSVRQRYLRLVVYRQSVRLGAEPIGTYGQNFFPQLNTCVHSSYIRVTSSLTRGWVCQLQLLLALARAFIFRSGSRGTREHILLSQIRGFPFCRLLRLAELRWRYSTPPPKRMNSLFTKSKLLYDWRFTNNVFVLESSPLRPTTRDFSPH
jgi:hypothetical protein